MDTDPRQDGHAERGSSPLHRLSKPLVGVSHRTRPRKIARSQLTDLESRRRDQFVDLPIKVAAAPNWLPDRRKSVLPRDDAGVGSTAMLNKKQTAIWFENPLHLRKGFRSVRNGAQRPRHHDGVDALIGKRQRLFGRLRQEVNFS